MINKRVIVIGFVAVFIFMVIFNLSFMSAGSLGMSPSFFKFDFEPNLEEKVSIRVADSDLNQDIGIYVLGDLKDYVTLSAEGFTGAGTLDVKIKLPSVLSKPGNHRILIGAIEKKNVVVGGSIGGVSAIQVPIDIFVPYPGKYAEAEFGMESVNEGEDVPYKIIISNLGTQAIDFKYSLKIINRDSFLEVIPPITYSGFLESKGQFITEAKINGTLIKPGNYIGFVQIDYGQKIDLNDSFSIGTFMVNITNYDYQFIAGKINKFSVSAKSFWNSPVKETYLEFSITDNGQVKSYSKTENYFIEPWAEKSLTGYIDATNITAGRYVGSLTLHYDGKTVNKLVAIYIINPRKTLIEKLLYVSAGIILLFVIITIYLVVRLILVRKNEKRKKMGK